MVLLSEKVTTYSLQELFKNKEMVKKMSKESERIAKKYDWNFIIKSLVDNIKEINF